MLLVILRLLDLLMTNRTFRHVVVVVVVVVAVVANRIFRHLVVVVVFCRKENGCSLF